MALGAGWCAGGAPGPITLEQHAGFTARAYSWPPQSPTTGGAMFRYSASSVIARWRRRISPNDVDTGRF